MVNARQKQVLRLAIRAGEIMMQSGAEIYRVEDTITRICTACHIPNVEVFATPTGIFVSLDPGEDDSDVFTYVSRLHYSNTNLRKISEINSFSREFTTTDLSRQEGLARLEEISREKRHPVWLNLIAACVVSMSFCLLMAGTPRDAICSGVIGTCSYLLSLFLYKYAINYFIRGLCCCAMATAMALLSVSLSLGQSSGAMVIGSLMLFVPGAAITNSIRDFLSGDMLAGIARFTEALVVAISLAAGAGIMLKIWSISGMTIQSMTTSEDLLIPILLGFASTFGFCILLNVPYRDILPATCIGGCGWLACELAAACGFGDIASTFLGACTVGLFSDILSRALHQASTVYTIPSIMILVPGARIYYTMVELIGGKLANAAILGAQTLFAAGAIAIGLLVVGAVISIILSINRHLVRAIKYK
ncbi:MAG: threonine/serine ThrE exporter family protein [Anaerovoracaceae bacterium]|jgi:uncharacterized membrane protein YjjP (DUF1212 family)